MVVMFLLSAVFIPLSTTYASDFEEKKPDSIVLDFSFFDLDPVADNEKFSAGAIQFLNDTCDLIDVLQNTNITDMNEYVKCAKAIRFDEICKYLNDDKYWNKIADYIKNDDRGSNFSSEFETIINFGDDYQKTYNNHISSSIDDMFNAAAKLNKSEFMQAIDLYNQAIQLCDSVITVLGDFKPAADKKAEAQKAIEKLNGNLDPKIFSSDVHKKNVGKILFSSNNIVAGKETDSSFSANYTASSNIYAVAYLATGVKTLQPSASYDGTYNAYETATASASVTIDGEILQYGGIAVPINIQDYQANKGYIKFELLPNEKSTIGYNFTEWYDFVFSKLKPGKHVIGISLVLNHGKVAEGQFEIDWTNADLAKISKNIKKCDKIATDYRANLRKVPQQFTVKHKKYDDASLSDKNIKDLFLKANKDATKILKFVNIGDLTDGWSVEKDDWDIPVAKYSTMETWVIYKAKDGWCYITEFKLKSTYTGGGTWGKPYLYAQMAPAKIAAKNVK